MCNCKGWDIAFYPDDVITVEPHFCRDLDDCGHVDNTLEEAANQVVQEYTILYDWYCDAANRDLLEVSQERLDWFLKQSREWYYRTHDSYLWYASPENN